MYTHGLTYTQIHVSQYKHTDTLMHIHAHTDTNAYCLKPIHAHPIPTHSHTYSYMEIIDAYLYIHTHSLINTHMHTDKNIFTLAYSYTLTFIVPHTSTYSHACTHKKNSCVHTHIHK